MIDYIIAGSSDCKETAELENHCNVVTSTFQNIKVKYIIKHPKEWVPFIKEICQIYGFKEKLNPICFTQKGDLIGSAVQFKEMLQKNYGYSELPQTKIHYVGKETNIAIVNQEYDNRHREKTLPEKLDAAFKSNSMKGRFTFNKEPFTRIIQRGDYHFLKLTAFSQPEVTVQKEQKTDTDKTEIKEPDWSISQALLLDKNPDEPEQEITKQDKKKITRDRSSVMSNFDFMKGGIRKPSMMSQAEMQMPNIGSKKEIIEQIDEENADLNGQEKSDIVQPKEGEEGYEEDIDQEDTESKLELEKIDETFIKLQEDMMKKLPVKKIVSQWLVSELENDYVLMLNPRSLFDKHCILYKNEDLGYYSKYLNNKKAFEIAIQDSKKIIKEKEETESIYYDFSKISKFRPEKVPDYSLFIDQEKAYNEGVSNLNSRFTNFESLFSQEDMKMILKQMKELDSYMFYGVLPDGEHDFKHYVNNNVHIIPRESFLKITNMGNSGFNLNQDLDMEAQFISWLGVQSDEQIRLENEKKENWKKVINNRTYRIEEIKWEIDCAIKNKVDRKEYKIKKALWEDCLTESDPDGGFNINTTNISKNTEKTDNLKKTKTKAKKKQKEEIKVEIQNSTQNEVLESKLVPPENKTGEGFRPIIQHSEKQVVINQEEESKELEYTCPYEKEFFMRLNFNFAHKIYKCPGGELPDAEEVNEILKHLALACKKEFNFDFNNSGASIIVGPKFICFVPYNTEYRNHYNVKLFVEPWNYLSFFTMPELIKQFPETAKIKDAHNSLEFENFMDLLAKIYIKKEIEVIKHPVKVDEEASTEPEQVIEGAGTETYKNESTQRMEITQNNFNSEQYLISKNS